MAAINANIFRFNFYPFANNYSSLTLRFGIFNAATR